MDSHLSWIVSKYSPLWGCARVKHCYNCRKLKGFYRLQILTSVQPTLIHVMCMLLVTIPLGLITAPVILGSMEVDKSALVN